MYVCACVHLYVWVWMCACHAVSMCKSEGKFRCWSPYSTFLICLKLDLLFTAAYARQTSPWAYGASPLLAFPLILGALPLQMWTTVASFMWILGIQTWAPILARQRLYPLSHLSNPPVLFNLSMWAWPSHPSHTLGSTAVLCWDGVCLQDAWALSLTFPLSPHSVPRGPQAGLHLLTFSPGHYVLSYLQNFVHIPCISVLALGCWCSRGWQIKKGPPCGSHSLSLSGDAKGTSVPLPLFRLLGVFDWWVWVILLTYTLTFGQTAPGPIDPWKASGKQWFFYKNCFWNLLTK